MLNFGLADRTVVVTGAASGIGLATALALAADGARVGVLDANGEGVERAVDLIARTAQSRGCVTGAVVDVRDRASIDEGRDRVAAELGPAWGLVTSAGIGGSSRTEDMPQEEWNRVLSVNATGVLLTCQAFGRGMLERGAGCIVLIGSVAGIGGQPARIHYNASKHAVTAIVQTLAIEWGHRGVRVNGVAPGPVETPLIDRAIPPAYRRGVYEDRTPLGRLAQASEVATASLMMLSDAARFVHGAMLPVDGGLMAGPFTAHHGADLGSSHLLSAGVYEDS